MGRPVGDDRLRPTGASTAVAGGLGAADLLALRPSVERQVQERVSDPDLAPDVVQEVLLRVWQARDRLRPDTAERYARKVAHHEISRLLGRFEREQASLHRLVGPVAAPSPLEHVLQDEEHAAADRAVGRLSAQDRHLLQRHYLHDGHLQDSSTPDGRAGGAQASRLAAVRARTRVSFLLALRRQDDPSPRCRAVLEALSAGDRRRLSRVRADQHLASCRSCAQAAPALLGRRRGSFAALLLGPLLVLLAGARRLGGRLRAHLPAATAAAAVTVLAAALLIMLGDAAPRTSPATSGALPAPALPGPALPADVALPAGLATSADGVVEGRTAVQTVPADEGFTVGSGSTQLWVLLVGAGESAVQVRPGDRVVLRGRLQRFDADASALEGVTVAEGRKQLASRSAYLRVRRADLMVLPG